jgi:biopolymer transport protein ExbD
MRFLNHKRRRTPSVIIVSLIDVLLVVLIFLMISTTFKKDLPSLKLALPQSKQAQSGGVEPKAFVVLVVTNYPFLYYENQPITIDNLLKVMVAAAKRDPQIKVAIKADRHAPFGEVIKVIDAAKEANVAGISAVTEKTSRPGA